MFKAFPAVLWKTHLSEYHRFFALYYVLRRVSTVIFNTFIPQISKNRKLLAHFRIPNPFDWKCLTMGMFVYKLPWAGNKKVKVVTQKYTRFHISTTVQDRYMVLFWDLQYRVVQKKLHTFCRVITFEPFVLVLHIKMRSRNCCSVPDREYLSSRQIFFANWLEVTTHQRWCHLHLNDKNGAFNCRRSLVN